jgi:uncharacterized membrane protein YqhA
VCALPNETDFPLFDHAPLPHTHRPGGAVVEVAPDDGDRMYDSRVAQLRFVAFVPVIFAAASSFLMSIVGAGKSVRAFRIYFLGTPLSESAAAPAHLDRSDQAMIAVIESVDAFLISIALLVFSLGVYNLFISGKLGDSPPGRARIFQIQSVARLKQVLMEVIMVILAVLFLKELLLNEDQLYWAMLVVPAAVALIALAMKWVNWKE